jgi:hypothetical protein
MTYSVWYYYPSNCYCVASGISFPEAAALFRYHTTNILAKAGSISMVRIFDSDFNTIAEWQYRKGIVLGSMPSTNG